MSYILNDGHSGTMQFRHETAPGAGYHGFAPIGADDGYGVDLTILNNWDRLGPELMKIERADDAKKLLEHEVAGKARPNFVSRLYHRFSKLRRDEEHKALAQGTLPWRASECGVERGAIQGPRVRAA